MYIDSNALLWKLSIRKKRPSGLFSLHLIKDESHLLLRSRLTMEDLESEDFKVHDPCVTWLNGKSLRSHHPPPPNNNMLVSVNPI